MKINIPREAPSWFGGVIRAVERALRAPFESPVRLQSITVATLPDPADFKGGLIYVSNEAGGAQPAFSDGSVWRRCTDRAIVS